MDITRALYQEADNKASSTIDFRNRFRKILEEENYSEDEIRRLFSNPFHSFLGKGEE